MAIYWQEVDSIHVGEKMQRWRLELLTLDAALHSTSGKNSHIEIRKTAHGEAQGLPTADCRTMFYATAAIAEAAFPYNKMENGLDSTFLHPWPEAERILRDAKGEVPDQQISSSKRMKIGVAG